MERNVLIDKLQEHIINKTCAEFAIFELDKNKIKDKISYTKFYNEVKNRGEKFKRIGLNKRCCLLYLPAGVDSVVTIYACFYAGIVPIIKTIGESVGQEKIVNQFHETINDFSFIGAVITNFGEAYLEQICEERSIAYINTKKLDEIPKLVIKELSFDDADMIMLTSGSTKASKGIKLTFEQLEQNIIYCKNIWNITNKSIGLTWMPHSHIYGILTGLMIPLYTGSTSYVTSPKDFSDDCSVWIRNLSLYRITHTHGAASNFALKNSVILYDSMNKKDLDLSKLEVLSLGGEAVNINLLDEFYNTFNKHGLKKSCLLPNCGMSEIAGLLSGVAIGEELVVLNLNQEKLKNNEIVESTDSDNYRIISVGKVQTDEVLILKPNEYESFEDLKIGEIVISPPSLSNGYVSESDNSSFEYLQINNEKRKFYRTGDLGFLFKSNLFITGRIKEVIKINGKNMSPYEIESCINTNLSNGLLGNNVAFSIIKNFQEELAIFQEVSVSMPLFEKERLKKQIIEILYTNLQIKVKNENLIILDNTKIPRMTNGKISRLECRKKYDELLESVVGVD